MVFEPIFRCRDKEFKTNRIILDGGSVGNYTVELCPKCYESQDKKFLIQEGLLSESKISLSMYKGNTVLDASG